MAALGRSRRGAPFWIAVLAAVAAAELVGSVLVAANMDDDEVRPQGIQGSPTSSPSPSPIESPTPTPPADEPPSYVNRRGGYGFDYPVSWDLRRSGTVTKITNPRKTVGVSFGLGARGPASRSFGLFVDLLEATYSDVDIADREIDVEVIAGLRAGRVSGTGTNEDGLPIRFIAYTIKAPDETYTIVAFATATIGEPVLEEELRPILDSFELVP